MKTNYLNIMKHFSGNWKKFLILSISILTLGVFDSCQNSDDPEHCESCESKNFNVVNLSILGKDFRLKEFPGNDGSKFAYAAENSASELDYLFEILKVKNISVDFDKLSAFVCYFKVDTDYRNLTLDDIKGVAFYSKVDDEKMRFQVYKSNDGSFTENKFFNSITYVVSSNDINDISKILFKNEVTSSFSFYNFENFLNREVAKRSELKMKIRTVLPNNSRRTKNGGDTCGAPCDKEEPNKDCVTHFSDETGAPLPMSFCQQPTCPKEEEEEHFEEQHPDQASMFNFGNMDTELHSFRDDYLNVYSGGDEIVDLYYSFSGKLDLSQLTLSMCVETFTIIDDYVIPMASDLKANPYSNTILINNTKALKMKNHLLDLKAIMLDQDAKDNVDKIVTKLNEFTNKTNSYITSHLSL